ncbi:hypothetical protein D3C80_1530940 [compost metagenome]
MGLAGVGIAGALQAVLAQTVQVGLRPRHDQRRFAPRRITDHTDLAIVQVGPQQRIVTGRRDRGADLQRPAIQVAEGTQPAVIARVVTRVHDRHHHEPLARQSGGQVMQGQRAAGIAVGEHQQRELPQRYRGFFGDIDRVAVDTAAAGGANGRVKRQRLHGLVIDGVGQGHVVQAGDPRRGFGLGQQAAEQDQRQQAARDVHRPAVPCRAKG